MKKTITEIIEIDEIIEIVSHETGVPITDIINPTRKEKIVLARHLSMWACRWNTKSSMQKIAKAHGKKNHGTVIHACTNIDNQSATNKTVKILSENIMKQIKL